MCPLCSRERDSANTRSSPSERESSASGGERGEHAHRRRADASLSRSSASRRRARDAASRLAASTRRSGGRGGERGERTEQHEPVRGTMSRSAASTRSSIGRGGEQGDRAEQQRADRRRARDGRGVVRVEYYSSAVCARKGLVNVRSDVHITKTTFYRAKTTVRG